MRPINSINGHYYLLAHFTSATMISLVLPPSFPRLAGAYASLYAESGREMTFANFVSRPLGPFLPPLSPCSSFLCRVMRGNAEARRVSSRHDDECRNVRLEARNSIVCSFVYARARVSRIYGKYCTPGLLESTGVYEISPSTPFSRCFRGDAFASTLDLFALHFARFSSRKSASASPSTRRLAPRATRSFCLPPPWRRKFACVFVGKAKHAAAAIWGKILRSLASTTSRFATASVNVLHPSPFPSPPFAYILQRALSSYISPRLSKVMSREQRGDNSKNFRANIGAASSHLLLRARVARKSSYYSFPSTAC